MRCSSCDSELIPGARFCDACGAPVEPVVEVKKPLDAPEPIPFETFDPVNESTSTPPPPIESFSPASSEFVSEVKPSNNLNSKMGLASVILGAVGILLSCIGCGGLIGLAGLVAGILALKTPDKKMGTIGIILSAVSILAALVVIVGFVIYLSLTANSGGYYYY